MTIEETRAAIFSSEDFVMEEFEKLRTLYKLKTEIRFAQERQDHVDTESVAEHVYAMHALAAYFRPLENLANDWDRELITTMIQFHDIDEIETGDTIGYLKTETLRTLESEAQVRVIAGLPDTLQSAVKAALQVYDDRITEEAKFVKAIDKIEPNFHLYNDQGKEILKRLSTTSAEHNSIKDPHMVDFPYIRRFHHVLRDRMYKEGFFSDSP